LGRESIRQGVHAASFGMALVVLFMLIYYRGAVINAVVALALNLLIVMGVMASLGATLTLPGIAGIVLTVGMAVDANVLIFERIREELRDGNTPQAAIHAGYDKAFSSLADASVPSVIAFVVLFAFGPGPIKGFAVTLSLGIITAMFTASVGTRSVGNLVFG